MEDDIGTVKLSGIIKQGAVNTAFKAVQRCHGRQGKGYTEDKNQSVMPAMNQFSKKKFYIHGYLFQLLILPSRRLIVF